MITTIKVNTEVEIKGCLSCPFHYCCEVHDYGEITGEDVCYCGLIKDVEKNYICDLDYGQVLGDVDYHETKLKDCPIISITKEEA